MMKPSNDYPPSGDARGNFVQIDGEPFVEILNVDAMPPFLMNIVSPGDLWMFAGSNCALTAGRVSPDRALLPYRTVDKILASSGGGNLFCSMLVEDPGGHCHLWEPWSACRCAPTRRNLYKHVTGGVLIFEEIHEQLVFRWRLGFSDRHGVVKKSSILNVGSAPVAIRCLEGLQHILPPGVPREMQDRKSYLALAYMRHEQAGHLSIYSINSGITDRAEPSESLRYAAGWTVGAPCAASVLSDRQVATFRTGGDIANESEVRGLAGSHLQMRELRLEPGTEVEWYSAVDTWLDHADLVRISNELKAPHDLLESLKRGCQENLHALQRRIGEVDGWQLEGDPAIRPHHAANALFNAMRGGLPACGDLVPPGDFPKFVAQRNREVAAQNAEWLAELPADIDVAELRALADTHTDRDIRRLAGEYLPLTFGRRHGDPSRPWNTFAIHVQERPGLPVLNYQGNWRDVFQNWEALALSYPLHLPAMIRVFLNATTADGYNAYRIERGGVDWDVFDPADPWSNIGYWGDHQIIYLSRLLDLHEQYFPGACASRLEVEDYIYTDVPYRIRAWEDLGKNPRDSIRFDSERNDELMARAKILGNDGKLLRDPHGQVIRATLSEKLLVPVLIKLANLVPGGGIWMNTQRPEWNDADNALAGWGLSMVTVCHLHRHLLLLRDIFQHVESCSLPSCIAEFLSAIGTIYQEGGAVAETCARLQFMERAGKAAEAYRTEVYAGHLGPRTNVPAAKILGVLESAASVCRSTILASRRTDGLFHSFNFLKIHEGGAGIQHLEVMLEGQVAVLASRCLPPEAAWEVVQALPASPLYRPDQDSYILYPDRRMVPILDRNRISKPEEAPILEEMAAAGLCSIAVRDASGGWHFEASLANANDLSARLDALEDEPRWSAAVRRDRNVLLAIWEETFHHAAFTGRSAGMFGFEGVGSIYWHMVAKLLLAVGECLSRAQATGASREVEVGLSLAYHKIRAGLGFSKTPAQYGAFPSDPYSHTPAHAGAQQPGMTGQVKEEILCRFLELGVKVQGGCLSFDPRLLRPKDFLSAPAPYSFLGKSGEWSSHEVPAEALAFTVCQTPVLYILSDVGSPIRVDYADGTSTDFSSGLSLSSEDTQAIIRRSPAILQVTVRVARERLASVNGPTTGIHPSP